MFFSRKQNNNMRWCYLAAHGIGNICLFAMLYGVWWTLICLGSPQKNSAQVGRDAGGNKRLITDTIE